MNVSTTEQVVARDVYQISEKVREIVPIYEADLLFELRAFEDTLWNQAPELRKSTHCWQPFLAILGKHIQTFDKDWQKKVLGLIRNDP